MRRNETASLLENWRNSRFACFAMGTTEIAIKLQKTFIGLFFLMTSVTHDTPRGKNLPRAAILQTFPAYCPSLRWFLREANQAG